MNDTEAHDVHHGLSAAVQLIDVAAKQPGGLPPEAPLAGGARDRIVQVARRLDHERRHKGAVANPNYADDGEVERVPVAALRAFLDNERAERVRCLPGRYPGGWTATLDRLAALVDGHERGGVPGESAGGAGR
jgi:hypothetical protein